MVPRAWLCHSAFPLVVGLTVVAFGTSAPEMAVSIGAALEGRTGLIAAGVRHLDHAGGDAGLPACLPIVITGRKIAR